MAERGDISDEDQDIDIESDVSKHNDRFILPDERNNILLFIVDRNPKLTSLALCLLSPSLTRRSPSL